MKNIELTFEEFFEDVWDYVSEEVVDDDYWDDNYKFIRDTTYDVYGIYRNNINLNIQIYAEFLEVFFKNLKKRK
jgi:hypothetical protein